MSADPMRPSDWWIVFLCVVAVAVAGLATGSILGSMVTP